MNFNKFDLLILILLQVVLTQSVSASSVSRNLNCSQIFQRQIKTSNIENNIKIRKSSTKINDSDLKESESRYKIKEVFDISRTEKTHSYVTSPTNNNDIIQAIEFAKSNKLKVTIKGTNHSHGGHNRKTEIANKTPSAIQLDMIHFNKIVSLNKEKLEVTVQPGVTWKELSVFLNSHGLAAMTEQSSNIFSVGGSVSTNIHGRDIHGPLINSIYKIKFINSSGIEVSASLHENSDIFRSIIGGYGGLGVITEVTLKVEKNYLYEAHSVQDTTVDNYVDYIKSLAHGSTDIMHYARVNISGRSGFTKVSYVKWIPIDDHTEAKSWKGWELNLNEKSKWISSMIMNLMRYAPTSKFGKYIKDVMDKFFGLPKTGTHKTKNNILNNPVQFLFDNFYNQKNSVDILQEYFIPPNKLQEFLVSLKNISEGNNLNLMNVTMRYVPKIDESKDGLLSPYSASTDLIAVVLYFNIRENGNPNNGNLVEYNGANWTQQLIKSAQALGGTFYWPYHRWWNASQITHNEVENIKKYFAIKDQLDPDNIFESDFIYHLRRAIN